MKPEFLEKAKVLFADSDINITDQGHKYLGSYIGGNIIIIIIIIIKIDAKYSIYVNNNL